MFKNEFQGGSYVEVFTAQSKDPLSGWKISNPPGVNKMFEKDVKSFVYVLEGSAANTKIQMPKDPRQSLSLIQRFLVLQVCVPKGLDFSIELGVQDLNGSKRRLFLSTAHKETQTNPLHSKIPLGLIKRSKWLNLCIDLLGFVSETWKGQTFKSLESICISANVHMRRIFTMKAPPVDTTDDEVNKDFLEGWLESIKNVIFHKDFLVTELYGFSGTNSREVESIPRQQQLAPDVPQETQVVNPTKIRCYEGKGMSQDVIAGSVASLQSINCDIDLNSSGGTKKMGGDADGYHIAFGTKVAGQRKGSGKESSRSAKLRADTTDGNQSVRGSSTPRRETSSAGSNSRKRHERKNSDPGTNLEDPELTVDKESLRTSKTWTDGADGKEEIPFVRPHPPREPSADKVRRKPRVKSAGNERTPHTGFTKDESSSMPASVSSSGSSGQAVSAIKSVPSVVADEEEVACILQKMSSSSCQRHSHSNSESELSSQNTSGVPDGEESISEVIKVLRHNDPHRPLPHPGEYEDTDEEYDADDDQVENRIYTFSSPPKSARHGQDLDRHRNKRNSLKSKKNHRTRRKSEDLERHERRLSGGQVYCSSEEEERVSVNHRVPRHSGRKHSHPTPQSRTLAKQELQSPNGLLSVVSPNGDENTSTQTPGASQTRRSISRKSLREIPKDDVRLSQTQKPYNHTKYQMEDLTESFEQQMLLSLKRQQDEDLAESDSQYPGPGPPTSDSRLNKLHYDDSMTDSSDESSMGTLRHRRIGQGHNYQEEMRQASAKMTNEFLSQSNPRDWGKVFSPPIILPSDLQQAATPLTVPQHGNKARNGTSEVGGSIQRERSGPTMETDEEEELDLLFDPVLNCYFDPRTCKYYELV